MRCVLSNWIFKLTLNEFSVTLEGFKTSGSSLKPAKHWNSTNIVHIFSTTELKSETGTLYVLDGPLDDVMGKIYGYPEWLMKKFRNGFPSDWKEILFKFYEDAREKGKLSSSYMENLLSGSPKSSSDDSAVFETKIQRTKRISSPSVENLTPVLSTKRTKRTSTSKVISNGKIQRRSTIEPKNNSNDKLFSPSKMPKICSKLVDLTFSNRLKKIQIENNCRIAQLPPNNVPEHRIVRDQCGTALAYFDDENLLVVTCFAHPLVVLESLTGPSVENRKDYPKTCGETKISHYTVRPRIKKSLLDANLKLTNDKIKKQSWSDNDVNLLKKSVEEKWPEGVKQWQIIANSLSQKRTVAACRTYARKFRKDLKIEIEPTTANEKFELGSRGKRSTKPKATKSSKEKKRKFPTLKERRQQQNALKLAVMGTADDADFFGGTNAQCFNFKILNVLRDDLSTAATPQSVAGSSRFGDFDSELLSLSLDVTTACASDSLLRSKTTQYVHQIQRNKPSKFIALQQRRVEEIKRPNKKYAGKVISILKNVDERRKLNITTDDESIIEEYFEPDVDE